MNLFPDTIQQMSYDEIISMIDSGVQMQPRMVSPIINGFMQGKFTVGTEIAGSNARVEIDGTNQRIIINDGQYDRVLIGYQAGGF